MCNLYRMTRNVDEVARLFGAEAEQGSNFVSEVYPGYPGLVVADGKARAMNWGFPVVLTGKKGQKLKPKPVTNARDDKLSGSFWRDSFERRRCLIPVSSWAEPEGQARQMTRTWYGLPGEDLFAVAGLWRQTAEWGLVYAMVMADSSAQMHEVHDRMPVILAPQDWARWTGGEAGGAFTLVRTWPGDLTVLQTADRWAGGGIADQLPFI
jgi:putative SOS response-associated peptidase YedK